MNKSKKIRSLKLPGQTTIQNISPFDFTIEALSSFSWEQKSNPALNVFYEQCRNWMVLGSKEAVFVLQTLPSFQILQKVTIPANQHDDYLMQHKTCVAWGLSKKFPFAALVLFSHSNCLRVYNTKSRKIVGQIRGHGAPITAIITHPKTPNIFSTISKDYTTRIYDLDQDIVEEKSLSWPPDTLPSQAGAAFGLSATEGEGEGVGRCLVVLVGGRSGGHQSTVWSAAWHPHLPVLATCGMDRAIKIWALPFLSTPYRQEPGLRRVDKPIFSTTNVHKAQIMSVNWLSDDVLLSVSSPSLVRFEDSEDSTTNQNNATNTIQEAGTIVIWKWTSLTRFFGSYTEGSRQMFRPLASDFQESSALTILTSHSLPHPADLYELPSVHLTDTTRSKGILLHTTQGSRSFNWVDLGGLTTDPHIPKHPTNLSAPTITIAPAAPFKAVQLPTRDPSGEAGLEGCCSSVGGGYVVAFGGNGRLWVWL